MVMPIQSIDATRSMVERWTQFTAVIAEDSQKVRNSAPDTRGELIVLGSGIAHADVMITDEATIMAADYVFHCLYDKVTQLWIDRLRPDALDLRILYDRNKDRHDSYVGMAEAMLYHVRRGKRVVAIYYGHPGIFATPTHRAIQIARKEGHAARMRPGISALDHLVADVGFDPMLPGLLSYEASDLLLRRRRLDPTLHTVIWQIGTVGEFQFDPKGFTNHGFDLFVGALVEAYGPDAEAVHYIAPQYVGIEPLIEKHRIGSLIEEPVRSKISALSTLYIPPAQVAPTDVERSICLRFDVPPDEELMYDFASYTPRERAAVARLSNFVAPSHYMVTGASPGSEFMLLLSRDVDLQRRYLTDPAGAIAGSRIVGLSERARQLLAIPHPTAINAAIAEPADEHFLDGEQRVATMAVAPVKRR